MSFHLTFTGVPLVLPPDSLEKWIDTNISIHDARMLVGPANHPGRNGGLTVLRAQENNRLKLYQLYYPNTASKWAEFWFLATRSQLDEIEINTYSTGEATMGELSLNTGNGVINTYMHMLPPRALAELGRTNQGRDLYLCCLVDGRYFWQGYKSTGEAELTSWATLFSTIATNMGISLTVDTIDPSYGIPSEYSELYNATQYANAAAFLDAACMNVGHRLIRTLDGFYQTKSYANCHNIYVANKQVLPATTKHAGGETISTYYAQDAYRQCVIIPEKFVVTYPVYCHDSQNYELPRTQQQQQPWSTGNIWTATVNTSDINPSGSASLGYVPGTTKVVHDTARAYYCECAGKSWTDQPQNENGLKELASQIARDYIDWKRYCTTPDYVLNGIQTWTPDGICDVTWEYSNHTCTTRVQGDPYNLDFEDLHHEITASCSSTSASSRSSSSRSSTSDSPSPSPSPSPPQRCTGTEYVRVGKGDLHRVGDEICEHQIDLVFKDGYFCYSRPVASPQCVAVCCSSSSYSSGCQGECFWVWFEDQGRWQLVMNCENDGCGCECPTCAGSVNEQIAATPCHPGNTSVDHCYPSPCSYSSSSSSSYSSSSGSSSSLSSSSQTESCPSECGNTRCVWVWDGFVAWSNPVPCTPPCDCQHPTGDGSYESQIYTACCGQVSNSSSSMSSSSGSSSSSMSSSSYNSSSSSRSSSSGSSNNSSSSSSSSGIYCLRSCQAIWTGTYWDQTISGCSPGCNCLFTPPLPPSGYGGEIRWGICIAD